MSDAETPVERDARLAKQAELERYERTASRVAYSEFVADGIQLAFHEKMHGEWEGQNVTMGQIREVILTACRERAGEWADKLAAMITVERDERDPTKVNMAFPLVDLRDLEDDAP